MKRYGYLYEKIYDFDNLYDAYLKARKNKRYRAETLKFTMNLEENLIDIQNELIWKTYKPLPVRQFYVNEPKRRLISAPAFYDRVVHHALCNIIEPIFDRTFIYHSFACRNGKGTHAAVDALIKFLRQAIAKHGRVYCLKGDISHFFPSIDHDILYHIIERKIKDPDVLRLIKGIIDGNEDSVGIGIGALTSQLFANIYLNELDHFVKERLRVHWYVRYMDDFLLLGADKEEMHRLRLEIEQFLWDKLRLRTNGKTQVFPANRGITFLGYRIWPTHTLLKSATKRRMKKKLRQLSKLYSDGKVTFSEVNASVQSYIGHMAHACTYEFRKNLFKHLTFNVKKERQINGRMVRQ